VNSFLKKQQKNRINKCLSVQRLVLRSENLRRKVKVDVFILNDQAVSAGGDLPVPALLINDGQDMQQLGLIDTLSSLYLSNRIPHMATVAIHAAKDRHQEYGTAEYTNYKKQGLKAARYSQFITLELVPFLKNQYGICHNPALTAFSGFSLGGLSALDISWRNPGLFLKVGVFSGSLWWRDKPVSKKNKNPQRIMHQIIRRSSKRSGMKFWFEAGTDDETHDRNNSGMIDAIEDTQDLIRELKAIGYTDNEITFRLIKGGEHNFETWSKAFPYFLVWAFGELSAG
jgi:enterochelin esterase-like enzyme